MSDNSFNLDYCWPSDFPDGVPEKCDVSPAEGTAYRLVRTIPPTEVDFQRHRDENADYVYNTKDINKSYGVSLWTKLSKIRRVEKNYPAPEQYGEWRTVSGDLCPELGVIHTRRDGHITLWMQEGAEPHKHINIEVNES